jgi:Kdo2-lipid IVA lauroyltransferase/acyltransferase
MAAMKFIVYPLTWLGLWPIRLIGLLPIGLGRRLTGWLALPMRLLMRRRAEIARTNLALCFPELDDHARGQLLRRHFRHLAESLAEIAVAWQRPSRLDQRFGEVVGLEHLERARSEGQGVVLLTGHVTCLELGARLFGEQVTARGIYRPLRNLVLNRFQNRGRERYAEDMLSRDDLRGMIRHLRSGGVLWYAPDQDFGPDRSLFAPFFGIQTATARAIVDLARMSRARVVPMIPLKDESSGRITVYLEPAFEGFPSGDPVADLGRFNDFLEQRIRQAPAQYWWLHRRFKTRPAGQSDPYSSSASG